MEGMEEMTISWVRVKTTDTSSSSILNLVDCSTFLSNYGTDKFGSYWDTRCCQIVWRWLRGPRGALVFDDCGRCVDVLVCDTAVAASDICALFIVFLYLWLQRISKSIFFFKSYSINHNSIYIR